jgi:hypothetical protein
MGLDIKRNYLISTYADLVSKSQYSHMRMRISVSEYVDAVIIYICMCIYPYIYNYAHVSNFKKFVMSLLLLGFGVKLYGL